MMFRRFFIVICEVPADDRAQLSASRFVPEFELKARAETFDSVIDRIKAQHFPVVEVLAVAPGIVVSAASHVALYWHDKIRADVPDDRNLPDFIMRHLPACRDVGYRPDGPKAFHKEPVS